MSDLIKRQLPIDRINKKLAEVYQYPKTEYAEGYVNACKAARQMISELPSAPKIIYCKDCVNHVDGYFCIKANRHTGDSEYCAEVFGAKERREVKQR